MRSPARYFVDVMIFYSTLLWADDRTNDFADYLSGAVC